MMEEVRSYLIEEDIMNLLKMNTFFKFVNSKFVNPQVMIKVTLDSIDEFLRDLQLLCQVYEVLLSL